MFKYPTEPCDECNQVTEQSQTLLEENDPIVAKLVEYANAEGYLRAKVNQLNKVDCENDRLRNDLGLANSTINRLQKDRDSFSYRANVAETKLYNIQAKARKAKKATKKTMKVTKKTKKVR